MKIFRRIMILICVSIICFSALTSCFYPIPTEYYIFQSIDECQAISKFEDVNSELMIYDSPVSDKHISKLEYSDFFAAEYTSDTVEFRIFAYVFKSDESAKCYFNNAKGIETNLDSTLNSSIGLGLDLKTHYDLVVIDGKNAYRVESSGAHAEEVTKRINDIFSKKIA